MTTAREDLDRLTQPLNPGIVELVNLLNEQGFSTCDSGDGSTHDYACDRDYPYVVIMSSKAKLIEDTDRLASLLRGKGVDIIPLTMDMDKPGIQATYNPADGHCIIDLTNVTDAMVFQ